MIIYRTSLWIESAVRIPNLTPLKDDSNRAPILKISKPDQSRQTKNCISFRSRSICQSHLSPELHLLLHYPLILPPPIVKHHSINGSIRPVFLAVSSLALSISSSSSLLCTMWYKCYPQLTISYGSQVVARWNVILEALVRPPLINHLQSFKGITSIRFTTGPSLPTMSQREQRLLLLSHSKKEKDWWRWRTWWVHCSKWEKEVT